MPKRIRIDQLLVQKGLVPSREAAQRLVLAGKVHIGEQPAAKPGQLVPEDADVHVIEGLKYVSRGGLKLEKALDDFGINVTGNIVLDIGASTGGFTDCVLQRDAAKVYAVDVGYGQLAWKIRQDPRVVVIERTNARFINREMFDQPIDLAVVDVSFIGLNKILNPLLPITGEVVALIKPQFEAGPKDVPRGGIIRDSAVHRKVLIDFYHNLQNWSVLGLIPSPVPGSSGNREFLVHLKKNNQGWDEDMYMQRVSELTI
jgi:23S rRNA (cytidine1920-2'-O)/16S rRNA (cytidine1409-2'-O)-methyltransferase